MKSPLEQAQHLKEGCCEICGIFNFRKYDYCPICKAKAQTLLETCEWLLDQKEYELEFGIRFNENIKQAISICRSILGK